MGTEILRPQDCLIEKIRVPPAVFNRRKNHYGSTKPNRKSVEKKRFNQAETTIKRSSSDEFRSGKSRVMGQVTILRRGELLDLQVKDEPVKKVGEDLIVCGTNRLGPDPKKVPEQISMKDLKAFMSASDVYAGSAFFISPSPSSLPLPSFSKRKEVFPIVDDSATKDLRRLLRLG